MSKPAGNSRAKLLAAARRLARERGCGAIKVREIARAAGVNLGLFHYHFKSREAFVKLVLEDVYSDFFSRLTLSAGTEGTPLERLRAALKAIAGFSRENRRLFVGMLRDAMNGDKLAAEFAAGHFPRHLPIIFGLIREAQAAKQLRVVPDPVIMGMLMGVISTPNIMATLVEESGAKKPLGRTVARFKRELLSDSAIDLRIDAILRGLAPAGAKS